MKNLLIYLILLSPLFTLSQNNTTQIITKEYDYESYNVEIVIEGNLSLYKSNDNYFLEDDVNGFRPFPYKEINGYTFSKFDYGTLSLYINKCKTAQNKAYKKARNLTITQVKDIVTEYNNCNLSNDIQLADSSLSTVNAPKEKVSFSISIGYALLQTDFTDFMQEPAKYNFETPTIGFKTQFNPNFLDKKLKFYFSADVFLNKKQFLETPNNYLDYESFFFTTFLGTKYMLLPKSSKTNPYLGAQGGLFFKSKSHLIMYPKENVLANYFYSISNQLGYNFFAGIQFNLMKQDFDLIFEYQPKIDFSLNSRSKTKLGNSHETLSGLNIKVAYTF